MFCIPVATGLSPAAEWAKDEPFEWLLKTLLVWTNELGNEDVARNRLFF